MAYLKLVFQVGHDPTLGQKTNTESRDGKQRRKAETESVSNSPSFIVQKIPRRNANPGTGNTRHLNFISSISRKEPADQTSLLYINRKR